MSENQLFKTRRAGVVYYQFAGLGEFPELVHQVFSRKGGLSEAPFNGLNVAFSVGDRTEDVQANRRLVAKAGKWRYTVYARQVHGTEILLLPGPETAAAMAACTPTGDALITAEPGVALVVQVADCQAIMIYDPARRVVANVHSGWRGSVNDIAGKTVAAMEAHFGCRGRDMVAAISPSLGPCCAEFVNYRSEIPEKFWRYKDDVDRFDFWKISCDQLAAAGLKPGNIHVAGMCTRCSSGHFFSYRGEGRHTGRFAVVIGLRPAGRIEGRPAVETPRLTEYFDET
jgi:polyphenol oxidase